MSKFSLLVPVFFFLFPSICMGTVTIVSQERHVSAGYQSSESFHAPNFGLFDSEAIGYALEYQFGSPEPLYVPWARATQVSSIVSGEHTTMISASGSVSGGGGVNGTGSGASSVCIIQFMIDMPTAYTLDAEWNHDFIVSGGDIYGLPSYRQSVISLVGPGVNDAIGGPPDNFQPPMTYTLDAQGVLQPGEYVLTVDFGLWSAFDGPSGDPMYDVSLALTVPSPSVAAIMLLGTMPGVRRRR